MKKNTIKRESTIGYNFKTFVASAKLAYGLRSTNSWFVSQAIPDDISYLGTRCTMDISGQEVVYFYNPGVNAVRNCPVAVTLAMANYRTLNVEAVIFVDDLFMRLSEETKKFVIAHEYGHAISGHFQKISEDEINWCKKHNIDHEKLVNSNSAKDQITITKMGNEIRNINYEFEADGVGVKAIGPRQAVRALAELDAIVPNVVRSKNFRNEMLKRVDYIKRAM